MGFLRRDVTGLRDMHDECKEGQCVCACTVCMCIECVVVSAIMYIMCKCVSVCVCVCVCVCARVSVHCKVKLVKSLQSKQSTITSFSFYPFFLLLSL